MKSAARPIFNALRSQRGFSAQAQAARADRTSFPKQEPKISRLPNGAIVASYENYSPVSKVAIVYNAGSKAETGDNVGITHCVRNLANRSTEKLSALAITRSVQQLGGSLTCSTSRDHVFYQMEVLRDGLSEGFEKLAAVARTPEFRWWELNGAAKLNNELKGDFVIHNNVDRIKLDLAFLQQNPGAQMVEALHAAAFRTGLGNSLYMPEYCVGSHTPEMLKAFISTHYTPSNMAVVGMGVDHDTLLNMVKASVAGSEPAPTLPASTYHGGEMRLSTSDQFVNAAIVTQGAGLGSKDLLALGVLQHVMGAGPSIKYSSNMTNSKVNQAAASAAAGPFAASCINMNYAETGLFGFHAVASRKDIGGVLKALAGQFANATKGGITDADVQRGKAQLKAAILMSGESSATLLEDVATQVLISGQLLQPQDIEGAINKITTADVQAVAKKVINGKPSMAAVGDLRDTPYLDQIVA